jgi:hypothetical protein
MNQDLKQNQTPRIYQDVNGFELRTGKFYDPNEFLNGAKFEIRILHKDPVVIEALREYLMEFLKK